jgi:hypothetical protein
VSAELELDRMSTGTNRLAVATGFALLQLQRGTTRVTTEDLSYAPDWLVKAYQMLKMLLPLASTCVHPDKLDVLVFNYFSAFDDVSTRGIGGWDGMRLGGRPALSLIHKQQGRKSVLGARCVVCGTATAASVVPRLSLTRDRSLPGWLCSMAYQQW